MYYQAINSVTEARSSIRMRFKDQLQGSFCAGSRLHFLPVRLDVRAAALMLMTPSVYSHTLLLFYFYSPIPVIPRLILCNTRLPCMNFVTSCALQSCDVSMGLSPIMTDVNLIFGKIQMCTAELLPNYELHLLQIACFGLDFAAIKGAVKLISRKSCWNTPVKVCFVQYPETFTSLFIVAMYRLCATIIELETWNEKNEISFSGYALYSACPCPWFAPPVI